MSDQQHTFTFRATAEGVEQAKTALSNMGVVVSQVDKLIGESKTSWERMRRNYVDGAKDVFDAQKAFTALNQAVLDGKANGSELAQVYTGITQKVGQAATQAAIATGQFGALSNAIKSIDTSSSNNAKAKVALENEARAAKQALAAYDPLVQAKLSIAKAQEVLNAEVERDPTYSDRAKQLLDAHTKSVMMDADAKDKALVTTDKLNMSHNKMLMLNAAAINSFQALASGMSVSRVAMMEGAQVVGAFIQESAGLSAVLTAAFTSVGAAIAAVTLAMVAGTVAVMNYQESIRKIASASQFTGGNNGATPAQLEQMAQRSAEAGKISVSSARDLQAAYIGVGKIGPEAMERLIVSTKDYSVATNQSLDEAKKDLADLFAKPYEGAVKLNGSLGILNDKRLAEIKILDAAGEKNKAIAIVMDALKPRIDKQAESLGWLRKTWDGVANSVSNAGDRMGKALSGPSNLSERRDDIVSIISSLRRKGKSSPAYISQLESQLEKIDLEIAEEQKKLLIESNKKRDNERSISAAKYARSIDPYASNLDDLDEKIASMEAGIGTQTGGHLNIIPNLARAYNSRNGLLTAQSSGLSLEEYRDKMMADAQRQSIGMPEQERARFLAESKVKSSNFGSLVTQEQEDAAIKRELIKLDSERNHKIQMQTAYSELLSEGASSVGVAWMQGAAQAARADAERQASLERFKDEVDVNTRAQELLRESISKTIEAGGQEANALQVQAAAQDSVANAALKGVQAQRQAELAEKIRVATLKETIALQNADAEQKKILLRIIDEKTKATTLSYESDKKNAAAGILQQQNDQLAILQAERGLILANDEDRQAELAMLAQRQQLLRDGSDAESDYGRQIIQNAGAISRQNSQLARAKDVAREFSGAMTSGLMDIAKGTKTWSESLTDVLNKMAEIIAQRYILEPAMNAAMGGLGGIFGGLFGGGDAVAAGSGAGWGVGDFVWPGSAKGNAFTASGVTPFAKGSAFTNSIVSRPTLFPFARGTGLMGEAGPEAIVPLTRTASGDLGVRTVGGGGAAPEIIINVIDQRSNSGGGQPPLQVQAQDGGGDGLRRVITLIAVDAVQKSIMYDGDRGVPAALRVRYGLGPVAGGGR